MDELRDATEHQRQRLLQQIDALQRSFDDIVDASDAANVDDEHDPEGATIAFERAQVRELLRRAHDELAQLDELATTLTTADGVQRRCEVCNDVIALERLLALPHVRRCVSCAQQQRRTLRS